MAIAITINGVAVSLVERGVKITKVLSQRAQCTATVSSPNDSWSPPIGAEIIVYVDGARQFGGLIYSVIRSRYAGTLYRWHELSAVGYEWIFDRRHITPYIFNEMYASDAIKFVVDNWINGLPASDNIATDLIPVGEGPLINDLTIGYSGRRESVSEVFAMIKARTGWEVWVDPLKRIRAVDPKDPPINVGGLYSLAPFPYESSNNFYANSLTIEETREQYANAIVAVFSDVSEMVSETFAPGAVWQAPDGIRTQWTMEFNIVQGSSVYVDDGAGTVTQQTIGKDGETGSQWYAQIGGMDIEQDPAEPVLPTGYTVTFNYLRTAEKVVYVENSAEIAARAAAEGTSGRYEKFFNDIPVSGFATLEAAAEAQLDQIDDRTLVFRWTGKGDYWLPVNPGNEITIKISNDIDTHAVFRVVEWTEDESGNRDCRLEAHSGPILKDGAQTFSELGAEDATMAVNGGVTTDAAIPEYTPNG